jgi:hypothetical protein
MAAEPDLTIAEPRRQFSGEGIATRRSAIGRFLIACGLNAKKETRHAAEQDRPDVAAARRAWRQRQPALGPDRLVLLDETWATIAMARRSSAPCGAPAWSPPCRMATGRPRPSWRRFATTAERALRVRRPRSTASASWPTSSRRWRRPCARATW